MKKDKNTPEYIYDTPTGIVEKEGAMYRGMGTYDPDRPKWVRVLAFLFAWCVFLFPGISLLAVAIWLFSEIKPEWGEVLPVLFLIVFSLFFIYAGIVVVRSNMKRKRE